MGALFLIESVAEAVLSIGCNNCLLFSTLVNWYVGRMVLFKASGNTKREISLVYIACYSGLALNLLIMWLLINKFGIWEMAAKIIASVIVFGWNYLFRTRFIYRQSLQEAA